MNNSISRIHLVGGLLAWFVIGGCALAPRLAPSKASEPRPTVTKTLDNGMKIVYVKDDSLPYLSLMMMVGSGSSADPVGQSGLASLVGELLDQGSQGLSAPQTADAFGELGSAFSAAAAQDYTLLSAESLARNGERLIDLFGKVVLQPSFADAEIVRVKKIRVSELRKMVDEPDDFATTLFASYLFGAHPYGRITAGDPRQVSALKKKDVVRFYLQNYRPNNSTLAVVGDFDERLMARIESMFSSWQRREIKPVQYAAVGGIEGVRIQLVDKPDLQQSQIRLGHVGIAQNSSDLYAVRVLNTILGGAFASRLVEEVRVKRGLTYGISSAFQAQRDPGPFVVSTFTRNDKVGETLRETLNVLAALQRKGVERDEVARAKAFIRGQYPRTIETAEKFAQLLLIRDFYRLPENFVRDYLKNIDAVSVSDVNRAAAQYLRSDRIKAVVFSPKAQTLDQLKALGEVEVKSYKDFL